MKPFHVIVLFLDILTVCVSLEHVWHSYQYDPIHKSREELFITNITSDDHFKLDNVVTKWKSLHLDKTCYLAGLMEKDVVIVFFTLNEEKDGFLQKSYEIDLDENPVDIALFQYWNSSSQNTEVMVVIGTQKPELLWYRIDETNNSFFWSWPITKNISHINIFQIEYDYHLLIISQHLSHTTADLYEFEPKESPNFWLRQKLELSDFASSSAFITVGPDSFLTIPQKSLNSILIYKLKENHFASYKNLSSGGVDEVMVFNVGHKSFLAFNGYNAGIYRFTKKDLVKETIVESHLDRVNYWLPIPLTVYGDDVMLIAQRSLEHGVHKSSPIEVITYNGEKFEEHEDISCLYFGEESLGLSCLPDEETDRGMVGSTSIFLGGVLGILVPRKNRSSELFLVKTDTRKIPNPLIKQIEEFVATKQYIDNLITAQETRYNEFVSLSGQPLDLLAIKTQLAEMEEDINVMKEQMASVDRSSTHYETAIFNGVVKIQSSGKFDEVQTEKINGEPADAVFADIVMKNKVGPIQGVKAFKELQTEELMVNRVNGVNSNNLLFASDSITINGDLVLTKPLTVFENVTAAEVNGLVFEDEVIDLERPVDELVFENLEIRGNASVKKFNNHSLPMKSNENFVFETLFLPRNMEVVNINGEGFNKFLNQLCLKNIRNYIPGTIKVNGDVTVLGNAKVELLNNLKFPAEYVFQNNTFPNITGIKQFSNSLATSEVRCEGTVDDISTSRVITLGTPQNIEGTTTFKNLKITESLNVDGQIIGEHASKFLPNPTLLESNFVKAKVNFKNLEVEGVIIIKENFNGNNLESVLSDFVYVNEDQPVIEAMKQFPEGFTVRKKLFTSSNSISNITLDSIVTKNTEQILNLTEIDGIVTFGNVETEGLYNSVDVKKLDEELVKLVGEQYISSTLIFEDEINVKELEIVESFTDMKNQELDNSIDVENIVVEGNIYATIDGFDLDDFDRSRMSFTKDQLVEAEFVVNKSFVRNMIPGKINNIELNEFTYEACEGKMVTKLINGGLNVKDFYVDSSVEIDKIDNKPVMSLGGSFWKHDIKKHNLSTLTFNDDVFFDKIEIEKLSGVAIDRYFKNIVFKNETEVKITGRKSFLNGITVKKLIETQKINGIPLSNILTRHGEQEIAGPVTIQGDVLFQSNVTVLENISNVPIAIITDIYQVVDDQFQIKGDVLFSRLAHIHNLEIQGHVDERQVQEVLDGIIYTEDDFKLQGLITFENKVNIEKNIRVNGKINKIDLPAFVSDMLMVTKDTNIKSDLRFTEAAFVEEQIVLHKSLKTNELNGINLGFWLENAIFIDKGFLKGRYMFEEVTIVDTLRTDYINDINTETLIPLRTQQNIPTLSFNEISVFKDVDVGNSTNFRNLSDEFANSILIHSSQDIDSDVEFLGKVFIEGDLTLLGSLNEFETNHIVTTNTDQNLSAIYNFKSKINLEKDLIVEGLVNGINVSTWAEEAVMVSTKNPQNISDDWLIDQDLIFEEDSTGNGLINGIDFQEFSKEIQDKRNYKYQIEKGFIDDYTNICKDLTYMYDKVKKQIYKFSYFENLQVLNFQSKIEHVYNFEYQNTIYLLISERKNCESYLFMFDSHFRYVKNLHFGPIAQIISVRYKDLMYLVIRNRPFYSACKVQGTNLWQLIDNDFVKRVNIEDQDLLQESLEPGTFYGKNGHVITEFKILPDLDTTVRKYRKWEVKEENMAFVPRGLATGLALRTGRKLIRLRRDDPIADDFSSDTENIIIGDSIEEFNTYLPGHKGSDLAVMKVGIKSNKRNLLAVASHEETSVKGSLDFIKIYEDVISGKVFHKVPTYKASSLVALEFNNGETLLAFMEDESVLQIYEYKGIEGFKHKLSAKLEGSKLFAMNLKKNKNERKIIGLVDRNKITFMEAVMLGNQIEENLRCSL